MGAYGRPHTLNGCPQSQSRAHILRPCDANLPPSSTKPADSIFAPSPSLQAPVYRKREQIFRLTLALWLPLARPAAGSLDIGAALCSLGAPFGLGTSRTS